MPIQVSAEVPGECFPGPESTRLISRWLATRPAEDRSHGQGK
jgi:hypothetical protein